VDRPNGIAVEQRHGAGKKRANKKEDHTMIIATVGRTTYKLEKIEEAETLLRILSRATTIEESYELPYDGDRYYEMPRGERIQVTIVEGKLLTYDEAQAAISAAREKKHQTETVTDQP
jgi:hypothetical protein